MRIDSTLKFLDNQRTVESSVESLKVKVKKKTLVNEFIDLKALESIHKFDIITTYHPKNSPHDILSGSFLFYFRQYNPYGVFKYLISILLYR